MAALVDKFPNVQFVITTHSPYVVGSVPKDKIKIYTCEKADETVEIAEFTEFSAFGADITRLTERLFKTGARVASAAQTINELREAISTNDFEKAETMLANIDTIDPSDPELERLSLLLRTKKRLAAV
jgi:predicted ATP-binding protein involved in virulence